jgi:hypothetical protein
MAAAVDKLAVNVETHYLLLLQNASVKAPIDCLTRLVFLDQKTLEAIRGRIQAMNDVQEAGTKKRLHILVDAALNIRTVSIFLNHLDLLRAQLKASQSNAEEREKRARALQQSVASTAAMNVEAAVAARAAELTRAEASLTELSRANEGLQREATANESAMDQKTSEIAEN